jgi:hypothetical protein
MHFVGDALASVFPRSQPQKTALSLMTKKGPSLPSEVFNDDCLTTCSTRSPLLYGRQKSREHA